MARPVKVRKVCCKSDDLCFAPLGKKGMELIRLVMTIDELEALRLADFEGMYHVDAAKSMGVSRQTFGSIVASARQKTAEAILHGKLLSVEGGSVIKVTGKKMEATG
jgi:predicted DNA-binding protein (UPF0251 family)